MPRKQSTSRKTGTVQKFIGTAYDEMKTLYDNLDALLNLEAGLEYGLRYLGPSVGTPPTTRVDGSPIEDGDFYFNTTSEALIYFDEADNIWFVVDPAEVLHARDEALAAALAAEEAKVGAQTAETGAQTAQASAETAENNAFLSEGEAKLSELAAGISATTAENYATQTGIDASNTAADAVSANTFADNANSSATAAGTHATNANNSATAAALSAQQAEQAFDSFDDKYLGSKNTPPTVDNDGDPLKVGATYYDENDNNLYYWNGAIWESPDKAASDAAQASAASAASALVSEGNANNSATAALTSETNAASSELAADNSRAAAELAEVGAETSETNAKTSETNAASSETNAKASEDSAIASATSAKDDANRAEQFAAGGNGLTKVAHEVARELRKRAYAGSGFAEWGVIRGDVNYQDNTINQGLTSRVNSSSWANSLITGSNNTGLDLGDSRTDEPIVIVDGVEHTISKVANSDSYITNKFNFPTAPDGSKSLNPFTGEVHKYHDLAGVGEAYETYSVDFDGSTYIDLTAVPYNFGVNSVGEIKIKQTSRPTGNQVLLGGVGFGMWIVQSTGNLGFSGYSEVKVNGEVVTSDTLSIEFNVEYHIEFTHSTAGVYAAIGANGGTFAEQFYGEIWDVILEDPALTAVGIPHRHYLNAEWQAASDAAPDSAVVVDRNGYTDEDWTPGFEGTGASVVIPEWYARVGATVSMMARLPSASGITQTLISSDEGNYIGLNSIGNWVISSRYSNVTANGLSITSGAVVDPSLIGVFVAIQFEVTQVVTMASIGSRNDGVFPWGGEIWDVRLTDPTNPENSRHYPLVINSSTQPDTLVAEDAAYDKDTTPFYTPDYLDSSSRHVNIPEFSATNYNIECMMKFDSTSDLTRTQVTGQHDNRRVYFGRAGNTGYLLWGWNGAVTTTTVIDPDVEYHFELQVRGNTASMFLDGVQIGESRTSTFDHSLTEYVIGAAGQNVAGGIVSDSIGGSIWDFRMTDIDDSTNSRFYPSLDYRLDGDTSGTALRETLQTPVNYSDGDYTTIWSTSPAWSTTSTEVIATANTGSLYEKSGIVGTDFEKLAGTAGATINVDFDCSGVTGTGGLRLVAAANAQLASKNCDAGSNTLRWINTDGIPISDLHFQKNSADFGAAITNIVVTVELNGTLVNFPVGSEWTLAQVDGATDGTLENFIVGSEWDNDLATDGTIVGTTLRTPMTLQDAQKCFLEAKYTDFEPIISRKDLVFLETWREKVVGFVRPFGNVQFGGSTHDGVSLVPVTNFVDQGYSAFGEWDTNTVGEVADWDGMSVEQKAVWAGNPKNNLFFDAEDSEYYQECYRIRVVEGKGDDWMSERMYSSNPSAGIMQYGIVTSSVTSNPSRNRARLQGSLAASLDYENSGDNFFTGSGRAESWGGRPSEDDYFWCERQNAGGTIRSEGRSTKASPIALVQRLNQGAYHPTWNSAGCARWVKSGGGYRQWWESQIAKDAITSTEQCMTIISTPQDTWYAALGTGNIGTSIGIGRTDQYDYYDAIYAGQVEDLRLNANKQDYTRLLTDSVRDGVAGETRGKGKVPFTRNAASGATTLTTGNANTVAIDLYLLPDISIDWIDWTGTPLGGDVAQGTLVYNGVSYAITNVAKHNSNDQYLYLYCPDITTPVAGETVDFVVGDWLSAEYDSLPWVDILGDPERIAATFPDGVVGQWINQIPDNNSHFFSFNKKANGEVQRQFTVDDGTNWTSGGVTEDFVQNGFTWAANALTVALLTYEALSDFTEPDTNRAVEGNLGDVFAGCRFESNQGNRLQPSLTGDIGKSSTSATNEWTFYKLNSYLWDSVTGGLSEFNREPTHTPLLLPTPTNDSNAVKALPHLVEKDGLLYVQWHGTQLVYVTPVINTTTDAVTSVVEGQIYQPIAGSGATSLLNVVVQATYTGGVNWANYTLVGGKIFANADLTNPTPNIVVWNGSGWGDDSEITIVDGESIKTDKNGNTVKVATHTEQIPIGIANKNQTK